MTASAVAATRSDGPRAHQRKHPPKAHHSKHRHHHHKRAHKRPARIRRNPEAAAQPAEVPDIPPTEAPDIQPAETFDIAPYSENPPTNQPYFVCPPPAKTRVSCMAIAVPPGARKLIQPAFEGSGMYGGYSPADLASAYKLPSKGGSGQTVAIVDAWDDPKAESDLAVYREKYGLPPCTTANGCFKKVNQKGETKNYPEGEPGWGTEISLDLDMVSAICPECHILLVEANDETFANLGPAENMAATLKATEISNSYGAYEFENETEWDTYFNHPGIPITVSSGDAGYRSEYPSASRYVISVGGTALKKDPGTRGWAEEAWDGAGSGCSPYESKPSWQKDTKCSHRMASDVSAVAAPETGVSIYDSYEWGGWDVFGGTSAAAPIIAAVEALSSSAIRAAGPEAFYKSPNWLFDVTVGSNGSCTPPAENEYFCNGELGYDGPTGNGAPNLTSSGKPAVASRATEVKAYSAQLKGIVNPEGSETHYHFDYGPTIAYGQQVPVVTEATVASGASPVTVSQSIFALQSEQEYHYRLAATNAKGTTYGEDHTLSTAGPTWAAQPTFSSSFGTGGTEDGQFTSPLGVAVEPTSGIVVTVDEGASRIEEFTTSGEFLRKFGSVGTGNGQFKTPAGVATDSKGNIWVADEGNNRIQEFNEKGEFIRKFGTEGSGNGQLHSPMDVAVDAKGNVWIADSWNARIEEFTEAGVYVRQFASGTFPFGVAVDSKGNVWNTNTSTSGMIQEHTETGGFVRSFGSYGSHNGELTEPRGLTVDRNGNVWVADGNHDLYKGASYSRIEIFTETGRYEEQFGSEGSGNEQMAFPFDIALDPSGNVWVSDNYNTRIDKWKIPSPWPATYSSSFGSHGIGDGQFESPLGVAVEPTNGSVVTVDGETGGNRIEVFSAAGAFVRKFGTQGSGSGQFKNPVGVATDSKGNIWVADRGNSRIQEFNEKGEFIRKFGTEGSGNGQLHSPMDVAVDAKGNVWVADSWNERIEEFTETGTYVRQFAAGGYPYGVAVDSKGNVWNTNTSTSGMIQEHTDSGTLVRSFGRYGEGPGEVWDLRGLAVDSAGNVWVIDSGNNRVQVFSETGEYLTKFGSHGSGSEQMAFPFDIALDPSGNVWVSDNYNTRIDKWKVPSPWPAIYSSSFGSEGAGDGQFKHPGDVAVGPKGNLWVVDENNNRIEEFSAGGEYMAKFGSFGTGNGQFSRPTSIAFDAKGNIWVTDAENSRVEQFNEKGQFVSTFGSFGSGNGQFFHPEGIAIDSKGNIWVADTYNGRVQKFNEKGEFIKVVGSHGSGTGQLGEPTGIDIGLGGNVWITDWQNNRLSEFNESGEFLRQVGSAGAGNGQFARPDGIDVDSKGNVWVGDQNNSRVEVFSETGEYVTQFGSSGSGAGQFKFSFPIGIATDDRGNTWITDTTNNRVQKWAP